MANSRESSRPNRARAAHLALTVCVGGAVAAHAADADKNTTSAVELQEVIVTADRQNAVDIQKAPIAISVVDTNEITRLGGQSYRDYLEALPSVVLRESSPGQNQFIIRGMVTGVFNQTDLQDRSLVSVYLDDTPISLQANTPDLKIFDLERVEVVRGPQGTLYGAGAMAGNIRFITVKPRTDKFDASAETTLERAHSDGTNYSVRGMVNLPLSSTLALRVNAYRGDNDGYVNNIGLGKDNANGDKTTQARGVLRWTPNDDLTVDLSQTYAKLNSDGEPTMWRQTTVPPQPFSTNNTDVPESYDDDFNLSNLTVSYSFGAAQLISSTSYVDRDFGRFTSGQTLVGRRNLGLDTVPYDSIQSFNNINNTLRDFSQEVRLQSHSEGRFKWITGVFYEHSRRTQVQDIPTVGYDAATGFSSTVLGAPHADDPFFGDQTITDRQWAVFGEATFTVLPRLNFTAGARYFNWHQDFDLYFAGLLGTDYDANFNPTGALIRSGVGGDETGTNPRAALSFQATDKLLVFAEAARGFRFGGVNQPIPVAPCGEAAPETFGSDRAWTYQVGEKARLLNDRMTLNLTAFLTNWSDVQTRKVIPECSYFFIVNDGAIRSRGAELESQARITDRLLFSINASYTDAEANGAIPNINALDGQRAPLVPRFIGSAGLNYKLPAFAAGTFEFSAAYQYRSGFVFDWLGAASRTTPTPSNDRIDVAVNYLSGGPWEAGVYVRNLADEQELSGISSSRRRLPQLDYQTISIGPGRIIGARFRYNF